jgi:hypothetical protein
MMAGANPAAVQRILRHSDPRITTEVYGHLAPGYLRAEIDRLHFRPPEPAAESPVERAVAATRAHGGPFAAGAGQQPPAASKPPTAPLAALVLQGRGRGASGASLEIRNTEESSASTVAGWTGLEPLEAETAKQQAARGLVRECRGRSRGSDPGSLCRRTPRHSVWLRLVPCRRGKGVPTTDGKVPEPEERIDQQLELPGRQIESSPRCQSRA